MRVTKDEFEMARRRGEARFRKTPCATNVRYERKRDRVVIGMSTGIEVAFRPRDAQGLERARPNQLDTIEISPSGLGIHFPKLDADIYLPALLEGFLGSKRWIAAELGKLGGSASTAAKAAAARRNGRLGGRPKKIKEGGLSGGKKTRLLRHGMQARRLRYKCSPTKPPRS